MGFKDRKFVKPSKDVQDVPSSHIYFAGLGHQMSTDPIILSKFLVDKFGPLLESAPTLDVEGNHDVHNGLYMPHDRRYCVASFQQLEHAVKAFDFFNNDPDLNFLGATKVVAKFAHMSDGRPKGTPEPVCTSSTDHIQVPGLLLLENFITEDEEIDLMNEVGSESCLWKESLCRRVQVCRCTMMRLFFLSQTWTALWFHF